MCLLTDGSVYVWGDNAFGQLPLGATASMRPHVLPLQAPLRGVTSIACGSRHSAIAFFDGKMLLCGFGEEGQLGGGPALAADTKAQRGGAARALFVDDSKPEHWAAESFGLGVRHTVIVARNVRAGVTRAVLRDAVSVPVKEQFLGRLRPEHEALRKASEEAPDDSDSFASSDEEPAVHVPAVDVALQKPSAQALEDQLKANRAKRAFAEKGKRRAAEERQSTAAVEEVEPEAEPEPEPEAEPDVEPDVEPEPAPEDPKPSTPDDDYEDDYEDDDEAAPVIVAKKADFSKVFYDDTIQDVDDCWIGHTARRARSRGASRGASGGSSSAALKERPGGAAPRAKRQGVVSSSRDVVSSSRDVAASSRGAAAASAPSRVAAFTPIRGAAVASAPSAAAPSRRNGPLKPPRRREPPSPYAAAPAHREPASGLPRDAASAPVASAKAAVSTAKSNFAKPNRQVLFAAAAPRKPPRPEAAGAAATSEAATGGAAAFMARASTLDWAD
mmetsp:Transcript_28972/g.102398  ORF Transcript_28972/g.102398 Transcript_28972/m.102398 type:complete len:501 (-) Transcript_28972:123-1625(-)